MKKLMMLLLAMTLLSACTADKLSADFINAKSEAEKAVTNLGNEAIRVKETVELKADQLQQAAGSVSAAANSINKATNDLKVLTGSTPNEELPPEN
ncbi:hypothetical protein HY463_01590 [Candidatus Peregrinibacteria bacterium]|nr:hypothetical protein [Candidatus Peregrinibacteria bacterium]